MLDGVGWGGDVDVNVPCSLGGLGASPEDMPEGTCGKAFSEALRSRGPDVPESVWPTRAGPILHYLNVVRNVDEWNPKLSLGHRPAGILVLPAWMSRMPLLLAVRRIVHSPVDPISPQ